MSIPEGVLHVYMPLKNFLIPFVYTTKRNILTKRFSAKFLKKKK